MVLEGKRSTNFLIEDERNPKGSQQSFVFYRSGIMEASFFISFRSAFYWRQTISSSISWKHLLIPGGPIHKIQLFLVSTG